MTCSVISVLCIRSRLIYREPRRGTGCAPGAHPGSSHASALPPYPLFFPPSSFRFPRSTAVRAFFFAPVFPLLFDLGEKKEAWRTVLFTLLIFSLSRIFKFPFFFLYLMRD